MTSRARSRRRQAIRCAHRKAAWQQRVNLSFGGVTALMALPVARRLEYDHQMRRRIEAAAEHYAEVNKLDTEDEPDLRLF